MKVASGRYAFASDERMALAGRALERIDALAAAVRSAPLAAQDERRLLRALDDVEEGLTQGAQGAAHGRRVRRRGGARALAARRFDATCDERRLDEDAGRAARLGAGARGAR